MTLQLDQASATADELLLALEAGEFLAAAKLIHPAAAQAFRDKQLDQHRHTEAFAKAPPSAFAGLPVDIAKILPTGPGRFLSAIWHVPDSTAFEALSPLVVVAEFLAYKFPVASSGPAAPARILGAVAEGEETVHVLIRRNRDQRLSAEWEPVAPLTLKRTSEGWRALLNGGLVYDHQGGYTIGLRGDTETSSPASTRAG